MPADQWLTPDQNDLKWGIVAEIEALGYMTEIFFDPRGKPGLAAAKAWSAVEADKVMRRSVGAVLIGMPRWIFRTPDGEVNLPTEFCQYEGAVAYTLGIPMLVLVQEDVMRRVVFDNSYHGYVGVIPRSTNRTWLATKKFLVPFGFWTNELEQRRDVFLGYCGSSELIARELRQFLQDDLGVTVLDWMIDFPPARSILENIVKAAARCSAGIFLFTQDDPSTDRAGKERALPRDNVVFEAGYFINAKGKDHVLIVLEEGTKMPADLGGDIYASLKQREGKKEKKKPQIDSVKDTIRKFVDAL
ncbi:MAG: TIR domain-containing protein [Candidatus Angelobacter sp.]